MYPISNAAKALFEAEQVQTLLITGTDANGTAISITGADVLANGFNIDRYCVNGSKIEVGTAIAAELTLNLNNADGQFNDIIFEGTELFVQIGIADWTQASPTITYIPCGYFTPDEQPRKSKIITISALDRMMKLDQPQPTPANWIDESDNYIVDADGNQLIFGAEIVFPSTVAGIVSQICTLRGITLAQSIANLPNASVTITSLPKLQQTITYRDMIRWCAGLMGTCAWFDWNGNLRFTWYGAASYTSTTANRYAGEVGENAIKITGVSYTNTQNVSLYSGTTDYMIDMSDNYFMGGNAATVLQNVRSVVNNFTYTPFEAETISAPYLWPMDIITYTDADGNDYSCIVTNVNFGVNSHTKLAGRGETEQTNEYAGNTSVTPEQALMVEQVAQRTADLDASLDQESVFRRLTNDGQTQGVILYNGQIYINASYINTGILNADLIQTGTINADLIQTGNLNADLITSGTLNADLIKAGTLNANLIRAGSINADLITSGSLNANIIKTGSINADLITSGTLDANLIRAGVIQGQSGASYWNLVTGLLSLVGGFTAQYTTTEGTFRMSLTEGGIELSLDGAVVGRIGWGEDGITMSGNAGNGSSISAVNVNQQGEAVSGSFVTVLPNGSIHLQGTDILVGEVDEVPIYTETGSFEYVKDVDPNDGTITTGTITVRNGMIIGIT